MQDPQIEAPLAPPPRTGRRLLVALVLLLLIAGGLLAAAWQVPSLRREIAGGLGLIEPPVRLVQAPPASAPLPSPTAAPAPIAPAPLPAPGSIDARLALLEERLARLDVKAEAASGNAARSEALLIAYAARRTLDRGAPLGYLEDQLRLRFADAQPNAVQTLVAAGTAPVTLDTLYAQLDAMALQLTGSAAEGDSWDWLKREASQLFVIRHQSAPGVRPEQRLARARLMLMAGRTTEAIAEVETLPGARAAQGWIAEARRYETVQRALDLIETTAMLDPRRLKDGDGTRVDQPSPLAGPPTV